METKNGSKALRETVRLLERRLGMLAERENSCCEVTFSQCHAVVELGRAGEISLNDLAVLLTLDKSTMSRTISALVGKGMVIREVDPEDRRYVSIRLTEMGEKKFHDIEVDMDEYFGRVYGRLPENRKEQVMESLNLLLQALDENDGAGNSPAGTRAVNVRGPEEKG
ncbi:MAG TPA: MarR family transcriptional regulator [Rectinemataceae bacterium]|nr:MarR family transcriptional regulator [Rectinemataceae bacterium]